MVFLLGACTTAQPPGASTPMVAQTRADSISCALKADGAKFVGTCSVTCTVNALGINFTGVEAKRVCSDPNRTVEVSLAKTAVAQRWLGSMQGVKPEDPTRFEVVPALGTNASIARTPFGWFNIVSMKEDAGSLSINIDASKQVRPNSSDLAIIARAKQMLSSEAVWNKNDNRECSAAQTKVSLFCALQLSTTEISGGVHYRQPALQSVREVLNTVDASRIKTHRIMDYNNHPATTLNEIYAVLNQAQALIEKDMRGQ